MRQVKDAIERTRRHGRIGPGFFWGAVDDVVVYLLWPPVVPAIAASTAASKGPLIFNVFAGNLTSVFHSFRVEPRAPKAGEGGVEGGGSYHLPPVSKGHGHGFQRSNFQMTRGQLGNFNGTPEKI